VGQQKRSTQASLLCEYASLGRRPRTTRAGGWLMNELHSYIMCWMVSLLLLAFASLLFWKWLLMRVAVYDDHASYGCSYDASAWELGWKSKNRFEPF
jgi:hypothetical protein